MSKAHPLHVLRITICLVLIILLLFGKPICMTVTCENGIDHVDIQTNDPVRLKTELEACNPNGLKCEPISFDSLYEFFDSKIRDAKLLVNVNFSLAAISNLFQIFMFFIGISPVVSLIFSDSHFMSWLFGLEMLVFVLLIIQTLACPIIKAYWELGLLYRFDYFAWIFALNAFGLLIFAIDVYKHSSNNPEAPNRKEECVRVELP